MTQLAVGTLLDQRYRVETLIARGGMSSVYRCLDLRLGRPVAAKVLDDRLMDDPVARERFRREARSMAQLSHPSLVNVYDTNSSGDHVFLIMELITGGTLRELLSERGPMPPHAATAVMRSVLTALAVAHREGMVHRDVKPDNVLINGNHQVKLADFGLVRAAANSHHTSDQIIGTVSYLSPEQVDGSSVGPASDVYSAGIVLFELLTGDTPFTGDNPMAHAYARLQSDVPPPSTRIDGVPPEFDDMVARACARNPADRYADAQEFLDAVDEAARSLHLPDFSVPVPRHGAAHRATTVVSPAMRPGPNEPADAANRGGEPREGLFPDSPGAAAPQPTTQETRTFGAVPPDSSGGPFVGTADPLGGLGAAGGPQGAAQPTAYDGSETHQAPAPSPARTSSTPRPAGNRRGIGFWVWLVVIALATAAVAVGGWWFGSGRYGDIPEVLGMDQQQAVAAVETAGFSVRTEEVYDDDIEAGQAVNTQPPFGERVPRGHDVVVLLSRGKPTVPSIPQDHDPIKYEAAVHDRTLEWSLGEAAYDDTVPAGKVLDASPSPGTEVKVGSTVSVILSKGPAPVEVPDVRGDSEDSARSALERAGLTVSEVRSEYDEGVDPGDAVSTIPDSGTALSRGDSVILVVSNAIEVPKVTGLSLDKAKEKLAEAGISVADASYVSHTGSVVDEVAGVSPSEGSGVDPNNASVSLEVANKVKVPSVLGKRVSDAVKQLTEAGFAVDASGLDKKDRVLAQNPLPGLTRDSSRGDITIELSGF
ncbi:Serine/threonine-protein kinase PknL [Corynebacterium ciconiae DSM 44920]|uniref:Stk1 family PASTA domain-containing Ser/Thr kinase n=1 Tax=Corynebacterium ciconiae TaxID=227319 RepID=UPI000377DEF1|nr:Stk1 family PASTA domain-containing Ser/Thr kinase [Corynebacterium ciconiae]WKD60768.1 Serine/threonine-protein kinase PknL [Corynebacterium ciconiae DSM 44920]